MLRTQRARWALGAALLVVAGCSTQQRAPAPTLRPEELRARVVALMPTSVPDKRGWAVDIGAAFTVLGLAPSDDNLCAVLAVAEQESGFQVDPAVPGLGRIAREEIDRRAERLAAVKTEKQLSDLYQEFIASVPLGQRLFSGANPVRTGGPMQVGVDFAERQVAERPYPYTMAGSVRDEVFSRRGGLYFGIAHLLAYPADYDRPLYRFADFNAGRWASRNAAFQQAVTVASGIPLDLDGDLVADAGDGTRHGATQVAVESIAARLDLGARAIRSDLEQGRSAEFSETALYARVFQLADTIDRRPQPRAVLPRIALHSPKITRSLTTEWFARRVDSRHQACLARAR